MPSKPERPAFYGLGGGRPGEVLTLLHPPYTAWHLSYFALGAAIAPHLYVDRLLWGLAAFGLAVGVDRPLPDRISVPCAAPGRPELRLVGGGWTAGTRVDRVFAGEHGRHVPQRPGKRDEKGVMKVSVFGLGYVGCVSAAALAADGHEVIGVDVNADKVDQVNRRMSPIVEPGLAELLAEDVQRSGVPYFSV